MKAIRSIANRVGVLCFCVALACGSRSVPESPAAAGSAAASASSAPSVTGAGISPDIANRALTTYVKDTGRADVRLCLYVDPSTGMDAPSTLALFQGAVDSLVRDGYTVLAASLVAVCPTAPLYLRTGTVHPKNSGNGTVAAAVRVTTPSPYLLWIVVTSTARIDAIFGGLTTRRGSEEMTCSGDNCGEVTGSIYVAPTDVATAAQRVLVEGLGLSGRPGG